MRLVEYDYKPEFASVMGINQLRETGIQIVALVFRHQVFGIDLALNLSQIFPPLEFPGYLCIYRYRFFSPEIFVFRHPYCIYSVGKIRKDLGSASWGMSR